MAEASGSFDWGSFFGQIGAGLLNYLGSRHKNDEEVHHYYDNEKEGQLQTLIEDVKKKEKELQTLKEEQDRKMKKFQEEMESKEGKSRERYEQELEAVRVQNEENLRAAMEDRSKALEEVREEYERQNRRAEADMVKMKLEELQARYLQLTENRNNYKDPFNRQVETVRKQQKTVNDLDEQIAQEESHLQQEFGDELNDENMLRIVAYGPTGHGKSTTMNRIWGDTTDKCTKGPFEMSDGVKSETQEIKKEVITGVYKYDVSLTDQPGTEDSNGNDRNHANNLVKYLRGIEFIHCIILVKSHHPPRFDKVWQRMLLQLQEMLGQKVWKHVVIVLTRADFEANLADYSKQVRSAFRKTVGVTKEEAKLPILFLDNFKNYKKPIDQLVHFIAPRCGKFECKDLRSPLETLKTQREMEANQLAMERNKLKQMREYLISVNEHIENIEKLIRQQVANFVPSDNLLDLNQSLEPIGQQLMAKEELKEEDGWRCPCSNFLNPMSSTECEICCMAREPFGMEDPSADGVSDPRDVFLFEEEEDVMHSVMASMNSTAFPDGNLEDFEAFESFQTGYDPYQQTYNYQ